MEQIDEEAQARIASLGLNIIWTMGKIEIDRMVSSVCEDIFTEKQIPPALVKDRANALRALGEVYIEAGEKLTAGSGKGSLPYDVPNFFKESAYGKKVAEEE